MKTTTREIAADESDIPAGWPRPYYRDDEGAIKYAQWSSNDAASQIMSCSSNRTYMAAAYMLCSSCGSQVSKGLIFDRDWLTENATEDASVILRPGDESESRSKIRNFKEFDTHYGSPICYRCALFAVTHCPYFSEIHRNFDGDIRWFVITSPNQYREFDDSTGLEVVNPDSLDRIMTSGVRTEVAAKNFHFTGLTCDDVPVRQRGYKPKNEWGFRDQVRWDPEDADSVQEFLKAQLAATEKA